MEHFDRLFDIQLMKRVNSVSQTGAVISVVVDLFAVMKFNGHMQDEKKFQQSSSSIWRLSPERVLHSLDNYKEIKEQSGIHICTHLQKKVDKDCHCGC